MGRLIQWPGRPSLSARAVVVAGGVAAVSTLLPWFSYSYLNGSSTVTSRLLGLHDVTGKAMLLAALAEVSFALLYLRARPGFGKRALRACMVIVAFFMLTVPLAAMAHAGAVPGSPAVDGAGTVGAAGVEATGAIGTVVALLAAFALLSASWITVLDSAGEHGTKRRAGNA
jgi:hypothetical protein